MWLMTSLKTACLFFFFLSPNASKITSRNVGLSCILKLIPSLLTQWFQKSELWCSPLLCNVPGVILFKRAGMFMNVCKLLIALYHVLPKIQKLHPLWNESKIETSFKYVEQTFLQAVLFHFLNRVKKHCSLFNLFLFNILFLVLEYAAS